MDGKFIDLTKPIYSGMPTFNAPWHARVSIERKGAIARVGRNTSAISFGSHTGTHLDAPSHFLENGITIGQIPLWRLNGRVSIADLSGQKITADMLKGKNMVERIIFILRGHAADPYSNWPYFSPDAAEFIVESGVRLVCLDTPSPENPSLPLAKGKNDSPVHKLWFSHGILLAENLAIPEELRQIGPEGWKISVNPLPLASCDASPARVFIYR